jgi:hypothetical protein
LHNIHDAEPKLFQSRWAMNFLAGPLTRAQIPALNQLVGAKMTSQAATQAMDVERLQPMRPLPASMSPSADAPTVMTSAPVAPRASPPKLPVDGSVTKPPIPAWIKEYYLPQNYSLPEAFSAAQKTMPPEVKIEGVVYRPSLLGSARVRILDRKLGVDSEIVRTVLVNAPEKRGTVRWEDHPYNGPSLENVDLTAVPAARFGTIDSPLNDTKLMTALQKDFTDWVYRNTSVKARANQALKVYAGPDISQAEFMKACAEAARDARDAEIAKKTATIDRQIKTIEDKLTREERELREDEAELSHRKMEEAGTHLENLTGLFGGRRKATRLSSSLTKRRMTEQAKSDVEESLDAIDDFKRQLTELQRRREEVITELTDKWGSEVGNVSEVTVAPKKTDVFVTLFGVAWLPYYNIQTGAGTMELPAFGPE